MDLIIENTATVSVDSIVICADESITKISLPNGYAIHKTAFDEYRNAKRIIDGNGELNSDYYCSRIIETTGRESKLYFYVLEKTEKITLPNIIIKPFVPCPIGNGSEHLKEYQQKEKAALLDLIYLLQVYKRGNIWLKEIYFSYHNSPLINERANANEKIIDVNPYSTNIYHLDDDEIKSWDIFYKENVCTGLVLMKDIVGLFSFALKQVERAVKFILLTTALEMMFLENEGEGKKEPLSKRVAVFSKTNDADIVARYSLMKDFYRLRSDSVHEGKFELTSSTEADTLEEITRECIKAYFYVCNKELSVDKTATWKTIKEKTIHCLKATIQIMNAPGGLFSTGK